MRRRSFLGSMGLALAASAWVGAGLPCQAVPAAEFGDDYHYFPASDPKQQKLNELVGKKMPPLSVDGWVNGQVNPADMQGKVVLVDIWATWCGPCVRSIPHNNAMNDKYKSQGLVIVGVCSSAQGQENLDAAIQKYKIAYTVCKDPQLATSTAYNLAFYPTYVAIDRNGVVRAAGVVPEKVEEVVTKLLKESAHQV